MANSRLRAATFPLKRPLEAPEVLPSVLDVVTTEKPADPLHCLRPATVTAAAERFIAQFPGAVLYAVKCNPEPSVLRALHRGGIRRFDVASVREAQLIRQLFADVELHYMHPVKARPAIREAWAKLGVRDFALDSPDELEKIRAETRPAKTGEAVLPGLFVRLALPKGGAVYDLSGKFGAEPEEAAVLLKAARPHAARLGLTFHVGSECLDPAAYTRAIAPAATVIQAAGVPVDVLDVGGGFPARYPGMEPPDLGAFMAAITAAVAEHRLGSLELWAEPGRALVAEGTSVVVQVLLRKKRRLYVNDGIYGALSDAGKPGFRYPARVIRLAGTPAAETAAFELMGPTCDSADRMKGPFILPADVREGDFIELGQLGAYGAALRTAFNGLDRARLVEVADEALS